MKKLHLDIFNLERKKVYLKLAEFANDGILGGGTAMALQIKHRYSYDFDIFFKKPITKKFLKKANKFFHIQEKLIDTDDELTFLTKDNIKITLLFYPFLPLYKTIAGGSISFFDIKDLAADKAATIGRRGAWRDYFDLFFLLKNKIINLEDLIIDAKKKFGVDFAIKLFLGQLTYYGDIKNYKIDFIDKKYQPTEIKQFFKQEVIKIKNKELFGKEK